MPLLLLEAQLSVFQQDGLQLPGALLAVLHRKAVFIRRHAVENLPPWNRELRIVVSEEGVALHTVHHFFLQVVAAGTGDVQELPLRLEGVGKQLLPFLVRGDAEDLVRHPLHPHLVETVADGDAVAVDAGGENVHMVVAHSMVTTPKPKIRRSRGR